MRRDGVVDDGLDSLVGEVLLQGIAPGVADDEEMPDRAGPSGYYGKTEVRG